ncbi:MAG: AmmeMemoRadiSam system radical SAM enzyme [bacterium]
MNRRDFLKTTCMATLSAGMGTFTSLAIADILDLNSRDTAPARGTPSAKGAASQKGYISPRKALFYMPDEASSLSLVCLLCPWKCSLSSGESGRCKVRENKNGELITLAYDNPCAVHIDPIEKNPLFHFLPGIKCLSVATAGCTFKCKYCQNWQISQSSPEETTNLQFTPKKIVSSAIKNKCQAMGYTYTEPTVFFEYMLDIAIEAKKNGLKNVYHSNGFINPEPLKKLCLYIDAANIDLKGFTEKYYHEMSAGRLAPVLESLKILKKEGVHVEITNTVVPTYNDIVADVERMCKWIRDELGDDVPLHFARFYPYHKLKNLSPTPTAIMEAMRNTATKIGMKYVYIGNIPGHSGEHTYCANCNKLLIRRFGFKILEYFIKDGECIYCGQKIPGKWTDNGS